MRTANDNPNMNEYDTEINLPYEQDTYVETAEESAAEGRAPLEETFVPRVPDPSAWPVDEIKYSVPKRDQLFLLAVSGFVAIITLLAVIFFVGARSVWMGERPLHQGNDQEAETDVDAPNLSTGAFADGAAGNVLYGNADKVESIAASDMYATHAALADVKNGVIIAANGADERVYPASLTKVMTLIVAAEHLSGEAALKETITISKETVAAMKAEGASGIGLMAGEKLTVESLLYMLMLKSDGVAACELARHIAGSEAAFVALMNEKASSMGLKDTHFVNPTGLHDGNHYSTCRDLATIMGYAMNMSLCRKIMTEDAIDASCTTSGGEVFDYHIYNNLLTTYFNDYKDIQPAKAGNLTVIAGKTGYTPESKYCLATCAQAADGSYYVCVTVGADSYENSIKSYQKIYSRYQITVK